LNLYGAADLESSQPCGYTPPASSSSSTTSAPTPTPTPTPSSCTSSVTMIPTPTCEYQCGSWCSNPLATFSDSSSCSRAAANCAIQIASCFLQAGYPASLNCFKYANWCSNVSSYCSNSCPGKSCSPSGCKSKYPPVGPSTSSPSVSTSVGPCSTSTSSITTSSPTVVPIPSSSCVCKQPNSPNKGYSSSSPVGSISIPCMICNNMKSDWYAGNWFKVYTNADSTQCKSYNSSSVQIGCQAACDAQRTSCMNTYAQNCKSNTQQQINQGADSYSSASTKCQNQWIDCYSTNKQASGGNLCKGWNSGWN
jgi:hypothetical protein